MIYDIIFTVLLVIIAIADIKLVDEEGYHIIPNKLLLVSLIITLPCVIVTGSFLYGLAGMGIGLAFFVTLHLIGPDRTGGGDVKLAGLIGLMLGYPLIFLSLPLAVITGGIASFILVALRRVKMRSIPFAPFLCGGTIASLWLGEWIISWYLCLY